MKIPLFRVNRPVSCPQKKKKNLKKLVLTLNFEGRLLRLYSIELVNKKILTVKISFPLMGKSE